MSCSLPSFFLALGADTAAFLWAAWSPVTSVPCALLGKVLSLQRSWAMTQSQSLKSHCGQSWGCTLDFGVVPVCWAPNWEGSHPTRGQQLPCTGGCCTCPTQTQHPHLQGRSPASPEAHPPTSIALTEAFGGPGSAQKSSSETQKPEGPLPRAGAESTSPAGLTFARRAQPSPSPVSLSTGRF